MRVFFLVAAAQGQLNVEQQVLFQSIVHHSTNVGIDPEGNVEVDHTKHYNDTSDPYPVYIGTAHSPRDKGTLTDNTLVGDMLSDYNDTFPDFSDTLTSTNILFFGKEQKKLRTNKMSGKHKKTTADEDDKASHEYGRRRRITPRRRSSSRRRVGVEWAFDRPAPEEPKDKSDCRDLLLNKIGGSKKLIWASYKPEGEWISKVLNGRSEAHGLYDGNYCHKCAKIYAKNDRVKSIKLGVYKASSSRPELVMHHKFALLDYIDSEETGIEAVVTGSFNWYDSAVTKNFEDIFYVRSRPIAEAFYKEYKKIKYPGNPKYLGNTDIVRDGDLAVAFDSKCKDFLVSHIQQATRSIRVAVWTISTGNDVYDALVNASMRNVNVSIITDKKKAEGRTYNTGVQVIKADMNNLADSKRAARRRVSQRRRVGMMHHKFMVVDEDVVVSGSYNFVTKSYSGNNENMVSVRHSPMAIAYNSHWNQMAGKWGDK